jgi:hypothetical protein
VLAGEESSSRHTASSSPLPPVPDLRVRGDEFKRGQRGHALVAASPLTYENMQVASGGGGSIERALLPATGRRGHPYPARQHRFFQQRNISRHQRMELGRTKRSLLRWCRGGNINEFRHVCDEMGDHAPSQSLPMPGRKERRGSAPSIVSLPRIREAARDTVARRR